MPAKSNSRAEAPGSPVARLAHVARIGRDLAVDVPDGIDRRRFIEAFYADADNDALETGADNLAAAALGQLAWGARRRPGRPKVRVYNPVSATDGWSSPHTIIETITDDSPFLVDSITMQIGASGLSLISNVHPILRVKRDGKGRLTAFADDGARAESWMQIAIPRIVDSTAIRDLRARLGATLDDVRLAVRDWRPMLSKLSHATAALATGARTPGKLRDEMRAFLDWLADNRFTFVGYCEYRDDGKNIVPIVESGLGLLRESRKLQGIATGARDGEAVIELSIAKAPIRSTIHRPAPLDDVGIAVFDKGGRRCEHRFLGLFTSVAYTEPPAGIPLLRMKTKAIMSQSRLDPVSHKGKALQHILDTLPRDELLQASAEELKSTALGILALEERPKARLFVRLDHRKNFFSCLVYLPRHQFDASTRVRVERMLSARLGGAVADSQATIGESALARIAITIAVGPASPTRIDHAALNAALTEAATGWPDRVRNALLKGHDETAALRLFARFGDRFPLAYQEAMPPERAVRDIPLIVNTLADEGGIRTVLDRSAAGDALHFTVIRRDAAVPLYESNPILENMGLKVAAEHNYHLDIGADTIWIQDFDLKTEARLDPAADGLADRFQQCFVQTLAGTVENDGFNSLIVHAGLDWRQANLLRAYCKYLLQTRLRFSQAYMLDTLTRYPALVRALVDLFRANFDPDLDETQSDTTRTAAQSAIRNELERATSLDDDRILRAFSSVVQSTLRTNYYLESAGSPREYVSFKLDPTRIPDLPKPRPKFEIFVFSRRVEGVHLRCGDVSRGGLRWSDRREDFRTEVLGLMKAQQVKNTVIVPNGAKGGFVCKQLPQGDRTAIQTEVTECYKTFLRGMLDITDNIVDGKTVTPARVLRRDDPDPYLVVAADKGTATFSDIANGISEAYGFWLGDAFASGGSAGYDHKKMGITARGAWESVKRHFREIGVDTQTDDFTVAGIGDMGGDVFGNGMLLSRHIRLVAAFNHMHIFLDPSPDAARSFDERKRLFDMPRSSWEDYDRSLISPGGGVFRRDAKSIALSPETRQALGIEDEALAPPDLIRAILKAPVDLLWNGGIGTYVRSSAESDMDAGDPVNDTVRVTGAALRCRVVGEGGNLGLTQLGRVEYALNGGRLNTDFIDNSGGVDSSDREVNIKILLSDAIERGALTRGRRNALLTRMTESVARQVLASNYAQSQALSMTAAHASERLGEHARLIRLLESRGLLDRAIEYLPSDEQIDERRKEGTGLTRPELAVVLSYAKIELYESLVASDIPDEPHCVAELVAYFPAQIGRRFGALIPHHRLSREITAMLIASSMVNRMGPFFALRAQEETGADSAQVARAYAVVRALFGTRQLWLDIEALDGQVQAQVQYDCFYQASRMVRRAVYWMLHRHQQNIDITATIDRMAPPVKRTMRVLPKALCGLARRRFENDTKDLENLGLPHAAAQKIAGLRLMTQVLDIVELTSATGTDPTEVAKLHFDLGRGLHLDWVREQIEGLEASGHWSAMARSALRETLGREQQTLVANVIRRSGTGAPGKALADWMGETNAQIVRTKRMFDEMQAAGQLDFATLSIALKEIGRMT